MQNPTVHITPADAIYAEKLARMYAFHGKSVPTETATPNTKPLDRITNSVAKTDNQVDSHEAKNKNIRRIYKMRRTSGLIVGGRQHNCGKKGLAMKQTRVDILKENDKYYYHGLMKCGNIWTCPVCSLKVSDHRSFEVREIVRNAHSGGCSSTFVTLTIQHNKYQTASELKKTVANSWREVLAHREYRDMKQEYNIEGNIRALEVTHKDTTGWHPHLHIMFLALCEGTELLEFSHKVIDLWCRIVKQAGYNADISGQNAQEVYNDGSTTVEDYITKWSVSKELTEGIAVKGSGKGRTPFTILSDISENKKMRASQDWQIYKEYATAFKGSRQLTYSKGLKKTYLPTEPDKTDEEIVNEEQNGELVLSLGMKLWLRVLSRQLEAEIIIAIRMGGIAAVEKMLRREFFAQGKIRVCDNFINIED